MTGGISEAPTVGIGKLLTESRFLVPNHQRDYSWSEDEVRQLFDDVETALEREDPIYFLGLMVFLYSTDSQFIVLDGQQRLATVIIVFSAIRGWLNQYSEHQSDADKIQERYIGHSELGEKELQPRLVLNAANDPIFTRYVVNAVASDDIAKFLDRLKKQDRSRKLVEATIYAHERIRKIAAEKGSPGEAARYFFGLVRYMRDKVSVVRLVVASEEVAFTIFETLNDRGLDLSPLDLVKNHLFSRADTQSAGRVRDMEARWAQMMATLSNVRSDNFLKAFWTSRHGRIRSTMLFDAFKRQYPDAEKALDLSMDMVEAAEQYAALDSADDPIWAPYSEATRVVVRSLKTIGNQQVHPVMLSALGRLTPPEVERIVRLLEVVLVRYQLIGGGNPGRLETTAAKLARMIHAGEVTNATQAFQELREVYPSDDEFKQAFATKQERSNQRAQYLLRALERQETRIQFGSLAEETQPGAVTVEHVLPKSPGEEWRDLIESDPSIVEDCVFRLGNMCLLTKVNKDIGRSSFDLKKKIYSESRIGITSELAEASHWNRETITHRQARMAKRAAEAWRFQ